MRNIRKSTNLMERNIEDTMRQLYESRASKKNIQTKINESVGSEEDLQVLVNKFKKFLPCDSNFISEQGDVLVLDYSLKSESSKETPFEQDGEMWYLSALRVSYKDNGQGWCFLYFKSIDSNDTVMDVYEIDKDIWKCNKPGCIIDADLIGDGLQQLLCKIAITINPQTKYRSVNVFGTRSEVLESKRPSNPKMRLAEGVVANCEYERENPELLDYKEIADESWDLVRHNVKNPDWVNLPADTLEAIEDGTFGDPVEVEKWVLIYATKYSDKPCPYSLRDALRNNVMLNLVNAYDRDSDGDWDTFAGDFNLVRIKPIKADDPEEFEEEVVKHPIYRNRDRYMSESMIREMATLSTGTRIVSQKLQHRWEDYINKNRNNPEKLENLNTRGFKLLDQIDTEATREKRFIWCIVWSLKAMGVEDCPADYADMKSHNIFINVIDKLQELGVPYSDIEHEWKELGTLEVTKSRGPRNKGDNQEEKKVTPPKPKRAVPKVYKDSDYQVDTDNKKVIYNNIPVIDLSDWDDLYQNVEPDEDDRITAQQVKDLDNKRYDEIPHIDISEFEEEEEADGDYYVVNVENVDPQDIPAESYTDVGLEGPTTAAPAPQTDDTAKEQEEDFDGDRAPNSEEDTQEATGEDTEEIEDLTNSEDGGFEVMPGFDQIPGEEPELDDEEEIEVVDEPATIESEPEIEGEIEVDDEPEVDDEIVDLTDTNPVVDDEIVDFTDTETVEPAAEDEYEFAEEVEDNDDDDFDTNDEFDEIEDFTAPANNDDDEFEFIEDDEVESHIIDMTGDDDDDDGFDINNIDVSDIEDKEHVERINPEDVKDDDFDDLGQEDTDEYDFSDIDDSAESHIIDANELDKSENRASSEDLTKASLNSENLEEYFDSSLNPLYAKKYPNKIFTQNGKIGIDFKLTNLTNRQSKYVRVWRDNLAELFNIAQLFSFSSNADVFNYMDIYVMIPPKDHILNHACFYNYREALKDSKDPKFHQVYIDLREKKDKLRKEIYNGNMFNANVVDADGKERPITFEDVEKWLADEGENKLLTEVYKNKSKRKLNEDLNSDSLNLEDYFDSSLNSIYAKEYPNKIFIKNGKIGIDFKLTNLSNRQSKYVRVWRDNLAELFNIAYLFNSLHTSKAFNYIDITITSQKDQILNTYYYDYIEELMSSDIPEYHQVYIDLREKKEKFIDMFVDAEPITFEDVEKWLADEGENKL